MSNSFDRHIESKLKNLSVKYHESYWIDFEAKLVEHKLLDEDQVEKPFVSGAASAVPDRAMWEQFANRLEKAENAAFDHAVKSKIGRLDYPYNEASWSLLYTKLIERDKKDKLIFHRLNRIAAAIILLLLGATTYIQLKQNQISQQWSTQYWEEQSKAIVESISDHASSSAESIIQQFESITSSIENAISKESDRSSSEVKKNQSQHIVYASDEVKESSERAVIEDRNNLLTSDLSNNLLSGIEPMVIAVNERRLPNSNMSMIETNSPDVIDYAAPERALVPIDHKNDIRTTLSIYPAYDINIVTTEGAGYGQEAVLSAGIGASVGIEKGNIGVNMGAKYQRIEYDNPSTLSDSKLDFVNIPLEVKYEPVSNENTSLYAIAGLEGHFALLSEFSTSVVSRSGQTQENTFKDGLARNGGFNNNAFATANVGVGIRHKMNDDVDLFGEIKYKNAITNVSLASGDGINLGLEFNIGATIGL